MTRLAGSVLKRFVRSYVAGRPALSPWENPVSFHLLAYTSGTLSTTANFDVPALTDDIFVISTATSHYLMDKDVAVLAAWAGSATLQRVRLASATLRQISQPYIRPVNVGVLPATDPNVANWLTNPFKLPMNEDVGVEATSDIAMGNERVTVLLWVTDGLDSLPPGEIIATRFTSTTAATANAWTTLAITLENQFPPGDYYLVMSEHYSTNGIAHRWIVPNQYYRPGGLSFATVGLRTALPFYQYEYGAWGRFKNTTVPRFQVLCNGADATHVGYMYIQRAA